MEESTITLGIDLHYFMDDEQRHEMDASIHNKCEASMIQVLNHLGDLFGEDIQIDVSALGEGGLIDKFKIVFKRPIHAAFWCFDKSFYMCFSIVG